MGSIMEIGRQLPRAHMAGGIHSLRSIACEWAHPNIGRMCRWMIGPIGTTLGISLVKALMISRSHTCPTTPERSYLPGPRKERSADP